MSFAALAACEPVSLSGPSLSGNAGQQIDPSAPVPVALLVPMQSGQSSDTLLAQDFEKAARLAIGDLSNVKIDLKVYNTAGTEAQAASAATQAANDGAKIIIGPLFANAANAAGVAVASRNINVLAFSNNASIAGGNVFILGATFQNTANRLSQFAKRQGRNRVLVVHADDVAGQVGRDAIVRAADRSGLQVAGIQSYPLSQQGIVGAAQGIAATAQSTGADTTFMTANPASDLPLLSSALGDNGINGASTMLLGLSRWSAQPQVPALPALQGGYFTLADRALETNFQKRYSAAYGANPHPLAGLAYDAVAAIGALAGTGSPDALTAGSLTRNSGFVGTQGIFRLRADGTNERGLAVAQIRDQQVVVVEQAPKNFSGAGF
ncbi:penicillin-binding protein activator [Algirhabdus cladophorae]|uniref:penicillin-binding protein activator n=1 Tax=Algirhabdus cladophorae TaxID=3377108 RepID=UPI003B84AC0F